MQANLLKPELAAGAQSASPPLLEKNWLRSFQEQVERTPGAVALACDQKEISYRELNDRVQALASQLNNLGVGPDVLVGICVERPVELVIGLLAILKAGGACLPLAPDESEERLALIIEDSRPPLLLTEEKLRPRFNSAGEQLKVRCLDPALGVTDGTQTTASTARPNLSADLACVSYAHNPGGPLQGLRLTYGQCEAAFAAMDRLLGTSSGVWLAARPSLWQGQMLEWLWALTRGFKVVLEAEHKLARASVSRRQSSKETLDFSLFYFGSDAGGSGDKYRLLIEGAKFADEHGFSAVWTPERHFHSIGGIYPNPAISSAAIATVTRRVQIRAGSVVLPLHNPVRVAEEWAVIDNLSHGRAGLSFASGWHANDFAIAPGNFAQRKQIMLEGIQTVRRLWAGETIAATSGSGEPIQLRIFPAPIQRQLPIWLTSSGNAETFQWAGEHGFKLLTHLFGQGFGDLAKKLELYREAWNKGGHPGEPQVTVMLHSFVWHDVADAWETVRTPLCNYLRTFRQLSQSARPGNGATERPALKEPTEDVDVLLRKAAERYFESSGLFGTPENCLPLVDKLRALGVNELACLIDFGVDDDAVLAGLEYLDQLRETINASGTYPVREELSNDGQAEILELIRRHNVTHLQCSASLANGLLQARHSRGALPSLSRLVFEDSPTEDASQDPGQLLTPRVIDFSEEPGATAHETPTTGATNAEGPIADSIYDRARKQREAFAQLARKR